MISYSALEQKKATIAVVGLGYVGLPLAVALAQNFSVIGFDISPDRVEALRQHEDKTGEVSSKVLEKSSLSYSANPSDLASASVIIVAVPTPIDAHRTPDLEPVKNASLTVGSHMQKGAVVVYESTVFPGVTEDICVPLLENTSGLSCGVDFTVGYSPERINPGDKVHTVDKIVKVVAGSDEATTTLLADLYGSVVTAGVHKAPSIRVAEAAKVIENTQRDLNIALMNELALIFDKLGIDTLDVLRAAGTKWNFLPFRPGLVGGHCIGVDPYYLTFKAEEAGYHPEVILAGRRINDTMGKFIAEKTVKMLVAAGERVGTSRVGIFGLTFKENVPDLRNTRVVDIRKELLEYGITPLIHDPLADSEEAKAEYNIILHPLEAMMNLDVIIFAVAHSSFLQMSLGEVKELYSTNSSNILLDIKGLWSKSEAEEHGLAYWRL